MPEYDYEMIQLSTDQDIGTALKILGRRGFRFVGTIRGSIPVMEREVPDPTSPEAKLAEIRRILEEEGEYGIGKVMQLLKGQELPTHHGEQVERILRREASE